MAKNVFDNTKIYKTPLFGHSFTDWPGSPGNSPELPGVFDADTVVISGELTGGVCEYAVFTVSEPSGNEYPASWVGTYRLPYDRLVANPPVYIADVPTPPEPEPDPDTPDDPADPDTPGDDDPADNAGDGET